MTEFLPQIIFKKESYLKEGNGNLHGHDPIYTNIVDRKCGEIILLANTKFWFLCTFCDQRFHSILVFQNHIKDVHIVDPENFKNIKDETPLDLHTNEECIVELMVESDRNSNCNDHFHFDIEEKSCRKTNEERKLDCNTEIWGRNNEVKDLVVTNRCDSNEMEEIIPNKSNQTQKFTIDFKNEGGSRSFIPEFESVTKKNSRTLICKDIIHASKNLPKNRHRKKKVYSCSYCQHTARDKITFKTHMQSNHGTRYQCEECGKCFGNRSNLRTHLVIHTGTRPYKCDFCDAGFSHSHSLKAHRYIHTGNRPYKCMQCEKGFVSSGALKVHMREHTGETPYVCQFCEKAFTTQCSYKRHMISHSGHRAYECKQCEKAFLHKETLTKHMVCHSIEKKFVCDTCQKKFNCKKNLIQHKKLHLNIKQYICQVCNKDFAQNAGLYSHMKCHKNKE